MFMKVENAQGGDVLAELDVDSCKQSCQANNRGKVRRSYLRLPEVPQAPVSRFVYGSRNRPPYASRRPGMSLRTSICSRLHLTVWSTTITRIPVWSQSPRTTDSAANSQSTTHHMTKHETTHEQPSSTERQLSTNVEKIRLSCRQCRSQLR